MFKDKIFRVIFDGLYQGNSGHAGFKAKQTMQDNVTPNRGLQMYMYHIINASGISKRAFPPPDPTIAINQVIMKQSNSKVAVDILFMYEELIEGLS